MFGKLTSRIAMTSLVAVAALVSLTGADCANENTGGLFDPTGQLSSNSGEPDFVFEGGGIYLNGVQLLGDPQYVGYSFEEEVITDEDNAKRADADSNASKSIVTNTSMSVNVRQFPIKPNTTVTFTPRVSGGTGLYWFFYRYESDANWTRAGNTYTRRVTHAPFETLYFAAIDTNNVQSDIRRWKVPVGEEVQAPNRLCQTIAGTTWSMSDSYQNLTITLPQGQAIGARVEGSWCDGENKIVGQIVASPSNCPFCVVVEGIWTEPGPPVEPPYEDPGVDEDGVPLPAPNGRIPGQCDKVSGFNRGQIRMTFEPDLASYNARWSVEGSSHWEGSLWSGSRSNCN